MMGPEQKLTVMFAGGGTGGHLFPGIALAEEFQKRGSGDRIVFVGTSHGLEARVIPREGFPLEFVRAAGFIGVSRMKQIRALLMMFGALADSLRIIRKYRPDILFGLGGYASFATVFMGIIMRVPAVILEQNSVPGFANKVLGKFSDAVCVTYQESISSFPRDRTYLTGNPVREKILRGSRTSGLKMFGLDPSKFTIFIFGGSGGASSINRAMVDSLQYLLDIRSEVQFLHQTGEKDYDFVRGSYRNFGYYGMVSPFIFQMAEAYAVSSMVISRAGATTLSEITALGKPSVLIPFPYATGNHQEMNARKLEKLQSAIMILDRELNGRSLAEAIRQMFRNNEMREKIQQNCRVLGQPQAGRKVLEIALSVLKKERAGV